jgi:hypothetical protein
MSASPSVDAIAGAVAEALGALVADKDTSQVDVVEGGLPEVVRRGRRERLSALIEGPLFEVLRDAGASTTLLQLPLPGGVQLVAGPLTDGRVALTLRRSAPTDASLAHLVEEGVVPAGVDGELLASVFLGLGLTILGPARAIRTRLAVAVAVAASARLRVVALGPEVPARVLPSPLGDDPIVRARAAIELGADVLFAVDLSPVTLAALLAAPLPVPLIATVSSSSMEGLMAGLAGLPRTLLGLAAVCAFDPEGRPRLVELHGDAAASSSPPPSSSASAPLPAPAPLSATMPPVPALPSSSASSSPSRRSPPSPVDEAPIQLEAPPAEWASEDIDDDPGWELGPVGASSSATSSPPRPGSFDAALQAAAKRPTFSPKAPQVHPQTAALRGTGGLTFEPPGGRGDDDGGGP